MSSTMSDHGDDAEESREEKIAFLVEKWGIPRDEAERLLENREVGP